MSTQRVHSLSLAAAVSMLLAAPGSAWAQQDTEAQDGQVARDAIDTIVVTARRREESIQDVPVAVSAFGTADLLELQARTLDSLQGAVPNANIVQGRGSASSVNVFIRGVGQPDALQTFDPGVGIYVDDVYLSRIQGALFSMFDVERIEVLRGPQGTLYGKNTAGGAIKIITLQPSEELRGSIEVGAGNHGRFETKAFASGPLSENVSASIAGLYSDSDGYVRDPDTGRKYNDDGSQAVRAKLVAHASDNVTLTFGADYTRQRNELTLGNPEAPLTQFDLVLGNVVLRPVVEESYQFKSRSSFTGDEGQELDHWGVSAVLDWTLSDAWAMKSITAYRALETSFFIDIDASEFELGDVLVELDQNQLSQELQFHFDAGGNMRGLFGLFYMNEEVPSHQEAYADDFLALAGTPLTFLRTIDDDLENRSYAAFAHGTWDFATDWSLGAGLRYTYEKKDYARTTSTFSSFPALEGTFAFTESKSWNALTPSVVLQKTFHSGFMGYASVNRGFKSGGFNGRANAPGDVSVFDPEFVWTYEVGIKTQSEDGRKFGNIVAFNSDYEDFQARVAEVVDPNAPIPNFSFPVINAGKLRIRGIEFEGGMQLGESTRISTQIGYQDAEYREFEDDRFAGGDRSGDKVPFSPRWTARLAAAHTVYSTRGASFTLGGDISYRSEAWLSVDNRDVLKQDSFTLIGAYGTWETSDDRWQVRAGVRNMTDRLYKTDAQEFASVGNIQTAYYGWPRQYYAAVRYNF